jgi:hypothetical protein
MLITAAALTPYTSKGRAGVVVSNIHPNYRNNIKVKLETG